MKKQHLSLAVKVNILIILITLGVSLLLVVISNRTYRKALLDPYSQKLGNLELPADDLLPYLNHFSTFFGTEELRQVRASADENSYVVIDWMDTQPSFTADDPEVQRENLFYDVIAFEYDIDLIWESIELDAYCVEILKDGIVYRVLSKDPDKNFSYTDEFGLEEEYFSILQPESLASPTFIEVDGHNWLMRCVQIPLDDAECRIWMVYDMQEATQQHRGFLLRSILYVLLLTAIASLLSVQLLWRHVTKPIRQLAEAATNFYPEEDGSYSADRISRVEIPSQDELGDLGREIRSMQTRIVDNMDRLTRLTAEKERINTELNMATQIQKSMLPSTFPPFPEEKTFDLYATMNAAREVGGDFYDFFMIDDDHLALVMADVSGKGVPAALFMMVSKAILKNNAKMGKSPGEILRITNETICSNNKMQMFVTVWLGILEISTGKITAANAGHEYPAIMKDGVFVLYKDKHSFVIGGMAGIPYKEYEFVLDKGDKLFLYTDGVTEAANGNNELFGTDRTIEALNTATGGDPREVLAAVQNAVTAFVGDAEQADDLTMLCLQYNGSF